MTWLTRWLKSQDTTADRIAAANERTAAAHERVADAVEAAADAIVERFTLPAPETNGHTPRKRIGR